MSHGSAQDSVMMHSSPETVNRVLTEEWDHDLVLEGIRAE